MTARRPICHIDGDGRCDFYAIAPGKLRAGRSNALALEFEFVILATSPYVGCKTLSPGWEVGTFFLHCVFARIPSPREATGHAQDDLGIYLTKQTAMRDMQRRLWPYSLPNCTETVLLRAMLRAVPSREDAAGLPLQTVDRPPPNPLRANSAFAFHRTSVDVCHAV